MSRVVNGTIHKNRRKKVLKQAKGFRGGRSKLYRTAKSAVMKAGLWSYRDRRTKKREMRQLWIIRINAAARENGISYSQLMYSLKKSNIEINRKVLAHIAFFDKESFMKIVKKCENN